MLNPPHRLNAINMRMLEELEEAVDELEADGEVRCVVIYGAGCKAFSVGIDVTLLTEVKPTTAPDVGARGQNVANKIEASSKPYIATIDGYCLGGARACFSLRLWNSFRPF